MTIVSACAVAIAGCDGGTSSARPKVAADASDGGEACDPSACPAGDKPCLIPGCTSDGACLLQPAADGAACDDGDPCTAPTTCQGGLCQGPSACCATDQDCAARDDGDLCNGTMFCDHAGPTPACAAAPGSAIVCDSSLDGACEAAACAPATGLCALAPRPDGTACDDGNDCTLGDACQAGSCDGNNTCPCQADADCQDDDNLCNGKPYCDKASHTCAVNPATVVVCPAGAKGACLAPQCQPATGSCAEAPLPDAATCDVDNHPCTLDKCQGGACQPGKIAAACACLGDADCAVTEDGDKCNGMMFCNKAKALCELNPATIVSCQTVDDSACLHNKCQPATGGCKMTPAADGSACDDGWDCTAGDACAAGVCAAKTNGCQCQVTADCAPYEAANACAKLYCDKPAGVCVTNPATVKHCPAATQPACAVSACDAKTGLCKELPVKDGAPCEADGSLCTNVDTCKDGACVATPSACPCQLDADCKPHEDGNPCNGTLYCDKVSGKCVVNPATIPTCVGPGAGPCKPEQCDPQDGGCKPIALPDGVTCDSDGFACTGEQCQGGTCAFAAELCLCWDLSDCAPFEDGDACNGTLYCAKGAPGACKLNPASVVMCPATSADGCATLACDPKDGSCQPTPTNEGKPCSDVNLCTTGDVCVAGVCKGPQALSCDDGNGCTVDACAPASGCTVTASAAACDDGDACTDGDVCNGGACKAGGGAPSCDDSNPCTVDDCAAATGCQHKAGQKGAPCTLQGQSGACDQGVCKPAPKAIAIAAGDYHTCALDAGGDVHCWGDHSSGQLGAGWSLKAASKPVKVPDIAKATAIAGGGEFHCALLAGGTARCWGSNFDGQLGDGSQTDSAKAVDVVGLAGAVTLAAGWGHACALFGDGKAACWGDNSFGQLGDGTDVSKAKPTPVAGLTNAIGLAAGSGHTCALLQSGTLRCWGRNAEGQLGDGTQIDRLTPTAVPGLAGVKAVVGGAFSTCALLGSGQVKCWGGNEFGQLGDGTTSDAVAPVTVKGLTDATALALRDSHACVLRGNGQVACWGASWSAQVGGLAGLGQKEPVTVAGLQGAVALSVGTMHSCALHATGAVSCWGSHESGQIGDGKPVATSSTATTVVGVQGASLLTAGAWHACAVLAKDKVACWGMNEHGQHGDGGQVSKSLPSAGVDLTGVAALAAGTRHSCAVAQGKVRCWGDNGVRQLGVGLNPAVSLVPLDVPGLNGVAKLAGRSYHSCALTGAGAAWCWGVNTFGQLGDGSTTIKAAPVQVASLSGATDLVVGFHHSCAIVAGGAVRCWGRNLYGQLGDGTKASQAKPTEVPGLTGAVALAAGSGHTCALVAAGQVWCWGDNSQGMIGDGTKTLRLTPVAVVGVQGGVAISAGDRHTCAVLGDGAVRCWGANFWGQAGNGSNTDAPLAVQVSDLQGAKQVALGTGFSCALLQSGGVRCWGSNDYGQLGDGNAWRLSPSPVDGFGG